LIFQENGAFEFSLNWGFRIKLFFKIHLKYLEKLFENHHRNYYSMMFLRENEKSKKMVRLNFLSIGALE
jgi:hypothetical protein